MSQKAVAKYFGVSVDTIARNLRDYGIQPHVNRDWSCSPKIQLSDIQKEVSVAIATSSNYYSVG